MVSQGASGRTDRTVRIWLTLMLLLAAACGGSPWEPARLGDFPPQVGWAVPAPTEAKADGAACAARPAAPALRCSAAGRRLALAPGQSTLELDEGRWVVMVAVPARAYVTVGVAGPVDALQRFEAIGPRRMRRLRTGAIDNDGKLPAFVSFEVASRSAEVAVIVDVTARVRLLRSVVDSSDIQARAARALKLGQAQPRALVGLPFPIERHAGYRPYAPHRYQFVRADVAAALRLALRQTRIRFKRNAIGIGDATQWNGKRPATDLGRPRHISHGGGRDVDIGLPSSDGSPSVLRRRCEGVLVDNDVLKCAPGTVRNLDAVRLAYLLGLLLDGPTPGGRHIADAGRRPGPSAIVETIFTDQAYIDEIRKALQVLRRKRWIHDEAFGALGEDGLLRPSPWHVDHLHVRFVGENARVPAVLRFESDPAVDQAPSKSNDGP